METEEIRAVVSGDEDSQAFVEAELREIVPELSPFAWLEGNPDEPSGVGLVRLPGEFETFAAEIARKNPIFLRHLAPVQTDVPLANNENDEPALIEAALGISYLIDPEFSFSVQSRLLGDRFRPFDRSELNKALFDAVAEQTGAALDARNPQQIVSVVCAKERAYLGVSWASQNRSLWPGGQHRFRREDGQISRSEFKLREAFAVFGIDPPQKGIALDLGASPGGWTSVLRQYGLTVIAVDPADLHERLRRDPQVVHIRERVQRYRPDRPCDMIVNDLKMDAPASIEILLRLQPYLKPGGLIAITLKLPKTVPSPRAMLEFVHQDIARLKDGFEILGARQLFHNRSEITVVGRKP